MLKKYKNIFFIVGFLCSTPLVYAAFTARDIEGMAFHPSSHFKSHASDKANLDFLWDKANLDFLNMVMITGAASGGGHPLLRFTLNLSSAVIYQSPGHYHFSTFTDFILGIRARNPLIAPPIVSLSSSGSESSSGSDFSLEDIQTLNSQTPSQIMAIAEGSSSTADSLTFLNWVNSRLDYAQQFSIANNASLYTFLFYQAQASVDVRYASGYSFPSLAALQAAYWGHSGN